MATPTQLDLQPLEEEPKSTKLDLQPLEEEAPPYSRATSDAEIDRIESSPGGPFEHRLPQPELTQLDLQPIEDKLRPRRPLAAGLLPEETSYRLRPQGAPPAPETYEEQTRQSYGPQELKISGRPAQLSEPKVPPAPPLYRILGQPTPSADEFAVRPTSQDLVQALNEGKISQQDIRQAAVDGRVPWDVANDVLEATATAEGIKTFAAGSAGLYGYPRIAHGAKELARGLEPDALTPEERYRAGSELVGGAMEAATPLVGAAGAVAPLRLAGGLLAGLGTGYAAGKATEAAGGSPEAKEFAQTVGFFLPSTLAAVSGLRTAGMRRTLFEKPGVAAGEMRAGTAEAFGGKAKAGVAEAPGRFEAKVRVGGKELGVQFDWRPAVKQATKLPPVPGPPPEPIPQAVLKAGETINAVARTQAIRQAGPTAAQPPPAPTGPEQLTPELMGNVASVIAAHPAAARAPLLKEAHGNLSQWMMDRGTFSLPDGKLATVSTKAQADTLAGKLINEGMDAYDKQAAVTTKEAVPPAVPALAKVPAAEQPSAAAAAPAEVTTPAAPLIGSKAQPVQEEAKATVDAQMEALKAGQIPVVMVPVGAKYQPTTPQGFERVAVATRYPGAGIYHYDPEKVTGEEIVTAAQAGTQGAMLGHVQNYAEAAAAKHAVIVRATAADGTILQESAVDGDQRDLVRKQQEILTERFPGSTVRVVTAKEAMAKGAPKEEKVEAKVAHGSETQAGVERHGKALAQAKEELPDASLSAQLRRADEIERGMRGGPAAALSTGAHVVLEDGSKGTVMSQAKPGKGSWVRVRLEGGGETTVQRAKVRTPDETLSESEREDRARVAIEAAGYEHLGGEDTESGRIIRYRDKETGAVARHKLGEAPTATRLKEGVDRATALARKTLDFEIREQADGTFRVYDGEGKKTDITAPLPAEAEKMLRDKRQVRNVTTVSRPAATAAAVAPPAPATPAAELPAAPAQAIPVAGTRDTVVRTATREEPAEYKLVEADDIIPSHDPFTFEERREYPRGVQERDYRTQQEAQARVVGQSQNFDPGFILNTSPTAVDGPPVVARVRFSGEAEPRLVVLSGNSREMTLARTRRLGGIGKYDYQLSQTLPQFGYAPGEERKLKQPEMVRELKREFRWPKDADELHALASDFNRPLTGALGVSERAVSAGKALKAESLERISQMIAGLGEEASLRELMDARGPELVRLMVDSGVWTERERPQFVDTSTGGLSDEGKQFVERALRGTLVDDAKLMDRIPRSILKKLDASLGDLATIAANPNYDLRPVLKEALAAHAEIAQRNTTVDSYLNQRGMFNTIRHPAVDLLVSKLSESTVQVRRAFRQFADDARFDQPGQATLGIIEKPAPYKSFNFAFGGDLTDAHYQDILTRVGGKAPEPSGEPEPPRAAVERKEPAPAEMPERTAAPAAEAPAAPAAADQEQEHLESVMKGAGYEPKPLPDSHEAPESPAASLQSGTVALAEAVYGKLKAGESLGNVTELNKLAEEHFGAGRTAGVWSPRDAFDAMEAGVNRYLLDVGEGFYHSGDVGDSLGKLRELMDRLTTQGVRTDEQVKNQQFSTPPTEALVVARLANIGPKDVVLEPSAGNGGLAVWAKVAGASVHVNEIADRRQGMLRWLGFDAPTAHDGELINSLLDPGVKPTVIVMNPPFSASTLKSFEAKNRATYGFNHVDSALQRLQPGGRLVTVLGGGRNGFPDEGATFTGTRSGHWFERIAEKYNIRANVRVSGKEYQKYGTSYATRIIVIDKTGPTPSRVAPGQAKTWDLVAQGSFDTLEEVYNALRDVAHSRPAPVLAGKPASLGKPHAEAGPAVDLEQSGRGGRGLFSGEQGTGGEVRPADRPAGPAGSLGGGRPGPPAESPALRQSGLGFAEPGEAAAAGSAGERPAPAEQRPLAGSHAGEQPEQVGAPLQLPLTGRETSDTALTLAHENPSEVAEEQDTAAYVLYRPSLKGPKHPAAIVETKTMATVPLPKLTYTPNLPQEMLDQGKLSAIQLEAVAAAGMQNQITLPDGSYASTLVGDGTGVGKGRTAAAILLDNWRQGRRRLVWVSANTELMEDAIRDLRGIGADQLARTVKSFGKFNNKAPIEHQGVLYATYGLLRSATLDGDTRIAQLEQWLRGKDNAEGAYIVFDESHYLKNAMPLGMSKPSQVGQAAKTLMLRLPKLRSVSLSATAAQDVNNLGYLDRLGLWGAGTAFPNGFAEFASHIGGGGVSAMEMVARELKGRGRYLSRTLSFKGVVYSEVPHVLTPDQREVYRTATKAWGSAFESVESSIKNTTNGGARQKANFMSLFYSAQQRFFNLLLTALKTPTAVKRANEALARGESVVISLINTNEAAQNREKNKVEAVGLDDDEPPDYDFGPKQILVDLVREHYPTQQWEDDVDDAGRPTKRAVMTTDAATGKPVPLINPEAVRERDELVARMERDLHMPENPLDVLINELGGPAKVAEITGRKERYDSGKGIFVKRGDAGVKRDHVNKAEEASFQSGKKRVAVISQAGGVGISLHAGFDVKNQQKRRGIVLQMGWSADRTMQSLGRIHRSNQAHPPEYDLLRSDLGGENRFVASISKRLASLNAIGRGEAGASMGNDLMAKVNFESSEGRKAANAFYTSLMRNDYIPGTTLRGMAILHELRVLKPSQTGSGMTVPEADRTNITRLLNRLLALDPDLQDAVYNFYYDIFQATVEQAIEDGTLDTGVMTLPGDEFHVKEERVISKDPDTGAETLYYPVEARVRTERMPVETLRSRIEKNAERNPRVMRGEKGELALVMDAPPVVHADGRTDRAVYVARPDAGHWQKTLDWKMRGWEPVEEWAKARSESSSSELNRALASVTDYERMVKRHPDNDYYDGLLNGARERLATVQLEAETQHGIGTDVGKYIEGEWQRAYEAAPVHRAVEHHLIGGPSVMRWWSAVWDANPGRLDIYTAIDATTKKRFVGVEIPPENIRAFLDRVTGSVTAVDARQMVTDVLKNNLRFDLEHGIQVKRGRVAGQWVLQFVPSSQEVGDNLKRLGVLYERGVQPIYYLPNALETRQNVLDRVLKEYPARAQGQKADDSDDSLKSLAVGLFGEQEGARLQKPSPAELAERPVRLAAYYQAAPGETPVVWVNDVGRDLVQGTRVPGVADPKAAAWLGQSVAPGLTEAVADQLENQVHDYANGWTTPARMQIGQLVNLLREAAADADKGGVVLAVRTGDASRDAATVREELMHSWTRRHGLTRGARAKKFAAVMMTHPGTETAVARLEKRGYDLSNPVVAAGEIISHIVANDLEALGLSIEDVRDWWATAAETMAEQRGTKFLDKLAAEKFVSDAMVELLHYVRDLREARDVLLEEEISYAREAYQPEAVPAIEGGGPAVLPESGGGRSQAEPGVLQSEPGPPPAGAAGAVEAGAEAPGQLAVTETPEFKRWFGDSKVVDAGGRPLVVYHGTTNDFDAFDPSRSDLGAHFGTAAQANARFGNLRELIKYFDVDGPEMKRLRSGGNPQVTPVYLRIARPVRLVDYGGFSVPEIAGQLRDQGVITKEEMLGWIEGDATDADARKVVERAGYDGVVYLNRREAVRPRYDASVTSDDDDLSDEEFRRKYPQAEDSYIAFHPTQIKSAIGNRGTFDPNEPSILLNRPPATEGDVGKPTMLRDRRGELVRAYHGTTATFEGPMRPGFRAVNEFGAGIYFGSSPGGTAAYWGKRGRVLEAHLEMAKPFDMTKELSKAEAVRILEAAKGEGEGAASLNHSLDWTISQVQQHLPETFKGHEVYSALTSWANSQGNVGALLSDGLRRLGYDGIIYRASGVKGGATSTLKGERAFVVFSPEQVHVVEPEDIRLFNRPKITVEQRNAMREFAFPGSLKGADNFVGFVFQDGSVAGAEDRDGMGRKQTHAEIAFEGLGRYPSADSEAEAVVDFTDATGALRVSGSDNVEIFSRPTAAQMSRLRELVGPRQANYDTPAGSGRGNMGAIQRAIDKAWPEEPLFNRPTLPDRVTSLGELTTNKEHAYRFRDADGKMTPLLHFVSVRPGGQVVFKPAEDTESTLETKVFHVYMGSKDDILSTGRHYIADRHYGGYVPISQESQQSKDLRPRTSEPSLLLNRPMPPEGQEREETASERPAGAGEPPTPPPPGRPAGGPPSAPTPPSGGRFAFSDPDTQAEVDAARGARKEGVLKRLREALEQGVHKATRTYEFLPRTGQFEPLRFDLKTLEKQRGYTNEQAVRHLKTILDKLDKDQYYNFSVKVLLDDLKQSSDEGLQIPFYREKLDALAEDHAAITGFVAKDQAVQDALASRAAIWKKVKDEYIAEMQRIGFNVADRLKRESYFRHQVLEYVSAQESSVRGAGPKLRTPTGRGFLKQRRGSELPINTDYLQAEHEVLAQMMYDTAVARTIGRVEERYDVMQELKRDAMLQNEAGIKEYFRQLAEVTGDDPMKMYRVQLNQKQAIAIGRLLKMAVEGDLPARVGRQDFADLIDDLREAYYRQQADKVDLAENFDAAKAQKLVDSNLAGETMRRLIRYASAILKSPVSNEARMTAATLFKGMAEKRAFIKDKLGEDYVTWRELLPDGYTRWQPREGTMVYLAKTIPERIADLLESGEAEKLGITPDMLRTVQAKGGRFREMVIPQEVADTLDNLKLDPVQTTLGKIGRGVTTPWKLWVLTSPKRWFKYNFRNLSGDAEPAFVGNPQGFLKAKQSMQELYGYYANHEITPLLEKWLERGGTESLLQAQEIGDINQLKMFKRLHDAEQQNVLKTAWVKAWQGYWKSARLSTDFRESILRYANFLSYLEQMRGNANGLPNDWGASNREEVAALTDPYDRAFKLSNDLLGAYDDLTVFGQEVRRTVYPFWSFQEVNMKRAWRMLVNSGYDPQAGGGARRAGTGTGGRANGQEPGDGWDAYRAAYKVFGRAARKSPFVAWRLAKMALKLSAFWAMMSGYNYVFFRKEEEELPDNIRARPHMIFGRDDQGNVRYLGRLGAMSDAIEWFGLDAPQTLVRDWLDGKMSGREVGKKMAENAVNKAVSGITPIIKVTGEMLIGKKTYPDIFRPSPIRDRLEYLMQQLDLRSEYQMLAGKPSKGVMPSIGDVFFNRIERNSTAYYQLLDDKRRFMATLNKGAGDYGWNPRSESLRQARLAMHLGDEQMAEKYMAEYFSLGGTTDGLQQSLRTMNPLYGLNEVERLRFFSQFTAEDWRNYERAMTYYQLYLSGPEEREAEAEGETEEAGEQQQP